MRKKQKIKDGFVYSLMLFASLTVGFSLIGIIVYILMQSADKLKISTVFGSVEESFLPMIAATTMTVVTALTLALPIGIMTAIYLNEYAHESRHSPKHGFWQNHLIGLAIDTLAGIPSIVYGLFGLLLFVRILNLGQSIAAGGLTLSIMILPVIIRTTEEALKTVPASFREGSLSLGATRFQTIRYVVLPPAMPGILTAAILATGRVVGESAPVLLTVGIARHLPKSIFEPGRTLTIHLYYLTKEAINPDDFALAFTAAAVLIIMILIINSMVKLIGLSFGQRENVD